MALKPVGVRGARPAVGARLPRMWGNKLGDMGRTQTAARDYREPAKRCLQTREDANRMADGWTSRN